MNKVMAMIPSLFRQRGASLVFITIILTSLLGFGALAIDVGYSLVVRNELQNAADASALSGARYLYPLVSGSPNWSLANSKAVSAIAQNKAANVLLNSGTIQTGYWNITGTPVGIHSGNQSSSDRPAIQVTITKSGSNGIMSPFFAGVLGINSFTPSAVAVAINGLSPSWTKKPILPIAIPGCVFGLGAGGAGTITYPSGQFAINTPYGPGGVGCYTGQWTPLTTTKDTSDRTMQDAITALSAGVPNSTQFAIGDSIYLQAGNKANLYKMINDCSLAGDGSCGYVTAPIVCPSSGSCNGVLTDTIEKIVGFVCVEVVNAVSTGPNKSVTYQVIPQSDPNYLANCVMENSGGIGPTNGEIIPPKLVNYAGNPY